MTRIVLFLLALWVSNVFAGTYTNQARLRPDHYNSALIGNTTARISVVYGYGNDFTTARTELMAAAGSASCQQLWQAYRDTYTWSFGYPGFSGIAVNPSWPSSMFTCSYANGQSLPLEFSVSTGSYTVCPPNSTQNGGTCTCNSGYVESGGQCVQQAQCTPPFVLDPDTNGCFQPCLKSAGKKGSTLLVFDLPSGSTVQQMVSQIGRKVTTNAVNEDGYTCAVETIIDTCGMLGTKVSCSGSELRFTGDPEVAAPEQLTPRTTTNDEKSAIENGNCSASMNGQTVYVPCSGTATGTDSIKTDSTGTTTQTGTTSTTSNSDGTTTTTDSRTTTNADGSTSTTTTTCTGNNCTSTTTTTDAQGNTTGTRTSTDTKEGFCTENPEAPICKRSTFNAAPCGTAPTCEGDAIQCAIVRKQYEDHCALWDKDDDPNSLANQAINGTDPNSANALQAAATVVNLPSTFDTSGYGWSRSCPADTEIDLGPMGGTLKLPFSKVCGLLNVLSVAAVGITLLAAAVWVVKG